MAATTKTIDPPGGGRGDGPEHPLIVLAVLQDIVAHAVHACGRAAWLLTSRAVDYYA
jgi:hypothetical protein